jgi:hypothetical protein
LLIYYDYFSFRFNNWLRLRCDDYLLRLRCHDDRCRLRRCDDYFFNFRLNFDWGILRTIFWIFSP